MRHLGKWLMAAGLLAAIPAVTNAGLFSDSPQEVRQKNQKVANEVSKALRDAKLQGYDIGIEITEGAAKLTGEVTDASQKEKASKVAAKVRGVKQIDNRLIVTPPKVRTAKKQQVPREIQLASASDDAPLNNQQMAERIAISLGNAGLSAFDLEVRFEDGEATIGGAVTNPEQRARITQVVAKTAGVESLDNQVTVSKNAAVRRPGGPSPYGASPMQGPIQQAAFHQEGGYRAPILQVAYQPDGGPMSAEPGLPMPPVPMTRGGAQQVSDMPNLPNHAWPSYAQYPNSAAVTYPKEYSASAWPYIGPFYPYPQVPMGWRAAQLEWDDGHWSLNFRSRTEKWWWFLSPKNW
jgi:osmotically-inducible protein OsmY